MAELYVFTSCISALVLSTIIIIITRLYLKGGGKRPPLPPGPIGLPIVGYLPFISTNLVHHTAHLAHKYGPIFKFYLGTKLYVVVSSPSLAKELLRDQDAAFCNRHANLALSATSSGGNGLVWSKHDDPQWRVFRKVLVQELMSSKRLDAFYGLRREEVRKVIRDLYAGGGGKAVPIWKVTFMSATKFMMNMVWGDSDDGEELSMLINKLFELAAAPNVADFFPGLGGFDLQGVVNKVKDVARSFSRILDGVIAIKKKEITKNDQRKDLLQLLLDFVDNTTDSDISITLPQLKAALLDTMSGGTDTTSTTTEWAMAELINNPDAMAKVQQELSEVVGMNSIVEDSHIPQLKYLEAVVKESMRLHPTGPMLFRTSTRPGLTLGGYSIPKDTRIFVNVWSIHRDPSAWDNPSEFRPERFLHDLHNNDQNCEFIPFGSGRRSCPGKPLAERMVMLLLASFLHSFDWRVPNKLDMAETFGITLLRTTPLLAIPTPRLLNSHIYM